jgi:hypothetical protein
MSKKKRNINTKIVEVIIFKNNDFFLEIIFSIIIK